MVRNTTLLEGGQISSNVDFFILDTELFSDVDTIGLDRRGGKIHHLSDLFCCLPLFDQGGHLNFWGGQVKELGR